MHDMTEQTKDATKEVVRIAAQAAAALAACVGTVAVLMIPVISSL